MALIKCPECGKEISDHAASCPNCGYPIQNKKVHRNIDKKLIIIPAAIILLIICIVAIRPKNEDIAPATQNAQDNDSAVIGDTIVEYTGTEEETKESIVPIDEYIVGSWEGEVYRITFTDNEFVYEKRDNTQSEFKFSSEGTYRIDKDMVKCETETGSGTDYDRSRPPVFLISQDDGKYILVGGGERLFKLESAVDTKEVISKSDKKYCSVEGCKKDPVREMWLGASGYADEYYCAEHRAVGDERWEKIHDSSFNACFAPACLNEGTHSITGLNGTNEYYCDKHFKEMQDTLNKMLGSSAQTSSNNTSPAVTVTGDDRVLYWTIATDEVKSRLKSPSTAKFPFSAISDGVDITQAGDLVTVKAYVDAQNAFGATLRSNFVVNIRLNGTKFSIESCIID